MYYNFSDNPVLLNFLWLFKIFNDDDLLLFNNSDDDKNNACNPTYFCTVIKEAYQLN